MHFVIQILTVLSPVLAGYAIYLQTKLNNLEVLMTTTKEGHAHKVAELTAKLHEHEKYGQELRNILDIKTQQYIEQTINYQHAVQAGNSAISQLNNSGGISQWYWVIGVVIFCGTAAILLLCLKQEHGIPDLVGSLANRTAACIEKNTEISTQSIIKSNESNAESILNGMKELLDQNNNYYTQILSSIKMDILELQEKSNFGMTEIISKSSIEIQKKTSDAYMDHLSSAMLDAYKSTPELVEIISKSVEEISKTI